MRYGGSYPRRGDVAQPFSGWLPHHAGQAGVRHLYRAFVASDLVFRGAVALREPLSLGGGDHHACEGRGDLPGPGRDLPGAGRRGADRAAELRARAVDERGQRALPAAVRAGQHLLHAGHAAGGGPPADAHLPFRPAGAPGGGALASDAVRQLLRPAGVHVEHAVLFVPDADVRPAGAVEPRPQRPAPPRGPAHGAGDRGQCPALHRPELQAQHIAGGRQRLHGLLQVLWPRTC